MSRSDDQRIADMLMAADEIATAVERGRSAFDDDVVLRRAMERSLEIVGEAAKSLSDEFTGSNPAIPVSDLAKVRDRISHHYHRVDPAQLWTIATVDIAAQATHLRESDFDEIGEPRAAPGVQQSGRVGLGSVTSCGHANSSISRRHGCRSTDGAPTTP